MAGAKIIMDIRDIIALLSLVAFSVIVKTSFPALLWTNARREMDRNGAVAATDFISAENWEP